MNQSRKIVNGILSNISFLKSKYENNQDDIIRLTSQSEYQRTIAHYDELIAKLSKELLTLPIGYRYSGKFYLKKPYSPYTEFLEYYGTIYLREDLISWQIESGVEPKDYSYHRHVFKEPSETAELTRQDAEPVYAKSL